MPSTHKAEPSSSTLPISMPISMPVAIWLGIMAVLVAMMVVIGGVTRLTGSGLSMVEWRPIMGLLPPLSEPEWSRVFGLYQSSPEFREINIDMDLSGFKTIFFWEYVHRVWGRLLGLAFGLPLLFFWVRGMIPAGLKPVLLALLFLGGMQGVIGWWMVTSGLVDNPAVSQYRLATHLSVALFIYGLLVWTSLTASAGKALHPRGHGLATLILVAITILAGAFVAGMDAGLLYNEYPLMGETLVPVEYGEKGLADAFENPASAQFHHRWIAVLAVLAVCGLWMRARKSAQAAMRGHLMAGLVACQFALGITTLLLGVPVWAGALHQLGAVLLLGAVLATLHALGQARA